MGQQYYIYSTRAQGWVNRGSTYGTQLSEAKKFDHAEAMAYCRRGNSTDGAVVLIPVPTDLAIEAGFGK